MFFDQAEENMQSNNKDAHDNGNKNDNRTYIRRWYDDIIFHK